MYKGSLFERLCGVIGENQGSYEDALYFSIANNLSKIFSTNEGSAQTVQDYGKPDLNNTNLSLKDSLERIEDFSIKCIQKYEPRLSNVRIAVTTDEYNGMNIFIEGHILIKNYQRIVKYKADLLSNGRVKVYKYDN